MKTLEKKWIRVRIYIIAFFFLFGLGAILLRAFQLQVFERERLDAIARAGYKAIVKLPPKRGTIYDREGHELAVSVRVGSVYGDPHLMEDKQKNARQLALVMNMPRESILPLLEKESSFVWIKRRISPDKIDKISALGLKGIGFTNEARRYYPGRDIAGHLLGLVGSDNQGLEGLERTYDQDLLGPQETLIQMRDALGRPFFISRPDGDEQGMRNLILTLDKDIQYQAQKALEAAVIKARAKSGQCLVMAPETGEILAMAVVPSFDPNVFQRFAPDQWRNRTITDLYEPGSTIKAMLLATALEKNIMGPNTEFFCENGEYRVADHIIHDTKEHGTLNVSDIIVLSSNIGAVKIGQEIGYRTFYEHLKKFGFGEKTGIDLIGERTGFVRPPEKAREIDQANTFFGQGMSVTSLQLLTAISAIANGGKLMRPFIVKAMTDQTGQVVKEFHPQMVRRVLSEDTSKKVTEILEGVVSERGTAPLAAIAGYGVAGKTGTSQKINPKTRTYSKTEYMAVFVGFVPTDNPKLSILVMIDEPKGSYYGGSVSGPVFSDVGKWALNNLRIHPTLKTAETRDALIMDDSLYTRTSNDLPLMSDSIELLPDFTGLTIREVLRKGNTLGLKIMIEGTGLASSQIPGKGSSMNEIKAVKVSFSPPV